MFAAIERHAPGFTASIVGRDLLSPLDLERVFGLTGGNIFHGAMSLDQLFWLRPARGLGEVPDPDQGPLPLRLRRPSPGEASSEPPGATRPGRSSGISAAAVRARR